MKKLLYHNKEVRAKILDGINKLADTVQVTLGPCGLNVGYKKRLQHCPVITKDGVTVAREFELEDPLENAGCQMVKEAAENTNRDAGDGTTTATVLARAIYKEGIKHITAGANAVEMKKGIDEAVKRAMDYIKALSVPVSSVKDIENVARISSNNDNAIATLISQAYEKVGKDGIITLDNSSDFSDSLDLAEGLCFKKGYLSPAFITNQENQEVVLDKPYIMIYESKISNGADVVRPLELAIKDKRPLLIVAEEVDSVALRTLVLNNANGIKCCAVRVPGYGDRRNIFCEDLAAVTGGTSFSIESSVNFNTFTKEMFGKCERIVITRDETTIIKGEGNKEEIDARVQSVKTLLSKATEPYDIEKLKERIASLTGGVAVLRIGAPSELELKEKKDRAEDAVRATKCAVEEGIVPGAGTTLILCQKQLKDYTSESSDKNIGFKILVKALEEPLKVIASNAGFEGSTVVNKIKEMGLEDKYPVFNARNGFFAHDAFNEGIVDTAKVCRAALQHAASVAGTALTTEAMIIEVAEENDNKMPQMNMM